MSTVQGAEGAQSLQKTSEPSITLVHDGQNFRRKVVGTDGDDCLREQIDSHSTDDR